MVLTLTEIQKLRGEGKYREVIDAVEMWPTENSGDTKQREGPEVLLEGAWARYQLGDYPIAEKDAMAVRSMRSVAGTDTGRSAQLLLAHCAERQGRLSDAEELLRDLPSSRARDNLYLTILIAKGRQGEEVSVVAAMSLATEAMIRAPYETVDGHILNNTAWLLYNAREQEGVKPVLPMVAAFAEGAIGIYEATGTASNHLAGALFRESHIFLDLGDWPKGALVVIEESIALWEQLVTQEGGERYQQNLAGAQAQRDKILARLGS